MVMPMPSFFKGVEDFVQEMRRHVDQLHSQVNKMKAVAKVSKNPATSPEAIAHGDKTFVELKTDINNSIYPAPVNASIQANEKVTSTSVDTQTKDHSNDDAPRPSLR